MLGIRLKLALATAVACHTSLAMADPIIIELTFSDAALAELTRRGEVVAVSAYWMGDPVEGATLPETEIGTIFLLAEKVTLQPGPARIVLGTNLDHAPLDQVTEPMLNVNVFTDRWTDEYNLIDCDFLDASLAMLAASPQAIHCRLIGE